MIVGKCMSEVEAVTNTKLDKSGTAGKLGKQNMRVHWCTASSGTTVGGEVFYTKYSETTTADGCKTVATTTKANALAAAYPSANMAYTANSCVYVPADAESAAASKESVLSY